MSTEVARRSVAFARKLSNDRPVLMTITGGEPLAVELLPNLLAELGNGGNIIRLCTTAGLEVRDACWRGLYAVGVRRLHLSLHGIGDDICVPIFGTSYKFERVDHNVDLALAAGIDIHVNHVLTRMNIGHFREVAGFAQQKGIEHVRILGLARQGEAAGNWDRLFLSEKEEASLVEEVCCIAREHALSVEFAGLPPLRRCTHADAQGICLGGTSFFHVDTVGNVFPCPSVKSLKSEELGTVFQPDNIAQTLGTPCDRRHTMSDSSLGIRCIDYIE